jgi:hypothetical protein
VYKKKEVFARKNSLLQVDLSSENDKYIRCSILRGTPEKQEETKGYRGDNAFC